MRLWDTEWYSAAELLSLDLPTYKHRRGESAHVQYFSLLPHRRAHAIRVNGKRRKKWNKIVVPVDFYFSSAANAIGCRRRHHHFPITRLQPLQDVQSVHAPKLPRNQRTTFEDTVRELVGLFSQNDYSKRHDGAHFFSPHIISSI